MSPIANTIITLEDMVKNTVKMPMIIGFLCAYVSAVFFIIMKYFLATRVAYKKGVMRW